MHGVILEVSIYQEAYTPSIMRVHPDTDVLVEAIAGCDSVVRDDADAFADRIQKFGDLIGYPLTEEFMLGQPCYFLDIKGVDYLADYLKRVKLGRLNSIKEELEKGPNATMWVIENLAGKDSYYYFLFDLLMYSEMSFLEDRLAWYLSQPEKQGMLFFGSYDYHI